MLYAIRQNCSTCAGLFAALVISFAENLHDWRGEYSARQSTYDANDRSQSRKVRGNISRSPWASTERQEPRYSIKVHLLNLRARLLFFLSRSLRRRHASGRDRSNQAELNQASAANYLMKLVWTSIDIWRDVENFWPARESRFTVSPVLSSWIVTFPVIINSIFERVSWMGEERVRSRTQY